MESEKVVVLSQKIIPGKEHFKLQVRLDDVTEILPEVKHRADVWYKLGEVTYCTHVGTHIEVPLHHVEGGADVSDFPVHKLIGPLVVLNFTGKKNREPITLDELRASNKKISAGDIVFLRTGLDKYYHTAQWDEEPYLTEEANQWLIDKKIGCLGCDCAGIEVPGTDYQPNHQALLKAGIPVIESLTNLEKVENGNYIVFVLPIPIKGIEASPLQVVAIKREGIR
jgi:arylformamidase